MSKKLEVVLENGKRVHPCVYGGDHYTGYGGYMEYRPTTTNALDKTKGTWVMVDKLGASLCQIDHCPHCGKELPLAPRGEPLPNMEADA